MQKNGLQRVRAARAFTLIEVVVASAILTLILMGLLATLSLDSRLRRHTAETALALSLLEVELERLRPLPIDEVDPSIRDEAPVGEERVVRPLDVTDAGGRPLEDAELTIRVLSEAETEVAFGLSSTPDLDGDADQSDFAAYAFVPVRLTLSWSSGAAARSESVDTVLYHAVRGN